MSFLKIKDPRERDRVVKEFLEIKKNIRANELAEKTGKIEFREGLSEIFKPVTEAQKTTAKEITEGLRPIKEGIEQLPQRIPKPKGVKQQIINFLGRPVITAPESGPSTSKEKISGIFPGSDTNFGLYEKGGEFFIGDKPVEEVEGVDGEWYIVIGDSPNKKSYLVTDRLYELLTSKNPDWGIVKANDISIYNKILIASNTLFINNDPKTEKLKSSPKVDKTEKWQHIIKDVWEKKVKGKGKKTGKGLKKIVIPCDPNALLERLDLLMASKAAGHTGLRNELVSVCDELKRQGIFDNKSYKRIMSLLYKMYVYKKKGFTKRKRYNGAGIFDSLANFLARLFSSSAAKQIASTAVDVGKSVAKEGAKKALEARKSAAIDAGKKLIEKALTPKSKKNLKKYNSIPAVTTPATSKSINALIAGSGNDPIAIQELVKKLNSGAGLKTT